MRASSRSAAVAALLAALVAAPSASAAGAGKAAPKPHPASVHNAAPHKVRETAEHALVHWINVQRRQRGLRPLAPSAQLTKVAHLHTEAMIAKRKVWHDPHLGKEVTGWVKLGEDVGKAGSLASIEYALLHTRANRVNILGPGFREIGIGTGGRDGSLYVTVLVLQPPQRTHH